MWYTARRNYLTLTTLVFVLLAGAVGIVQVTYFCSQKLLVSTTGHILALAATETAAKLDSMLEQRVTDVEVLGVLLANDFDHIDFMQGEISRVATHYPIYLWIGVADAHGRIVAASHQETRGLMVQGQQWFEQVRRSKKSVVRDIEPTSFIDGGPDALAISAPVLDENGTLLGVVSARIACTTIEAHVMNTVYRLRKESPLFDAMEYQFITSDGRAFIDSDLEHKGNVNLKALNLPSATLQVDGPKVIEEDHLRRHVAVLSGFADTHAVASGSQAGWRVLMRLDKPTILASTQYFAWFIGSTTGVLLCFLAALFWSIRRLYGALSSAQAESSRARHAEQAMRESEARARAIIENTLDAVIVTDKEGCVIEWNGNAETLFGWTREEAVGQDCATLIIPPALRRQHYLGIQRYLDSGKSAMLNRRTELYAITRHGTEIPIELSVSLLLRDGQPCFSAFLRDISTQVKSQAALREAKDRAELSAAEKSMILNTVDLFFVRLDRDQVIREWTPAAERILGMRSQDVLGCRFDSLNIKWQVAAPGPHVCFLTNGKSAPCTHARVRVHRPDGGSVLVRLAIKPVQIDHDEGLILMGEDITEQDRLQQEVGRAQKWEAIGQLAAGIAHEVNTPTQYILDNTNFLSESFVQILRVMADYRDLVMRTDAQRITDETLAQARQSLEETDLDFLLDEIPKALRQSMDGLSRVSAIVRAMKEFAHPDSPDPSSADINHCIRSTVEIARNEWKYHADMKLDLCPDVPPVLCFPNELNQVILNLIVNGVHAIQARCDNQRGVIKIGSRAKKDMIEIRVSDSGTGIPAEIRDRIFDPFFTTKEVGRGTGQGLSIARSVIVNKHHGSITFETEEGVGTTFIITLPLARSAEVDGFQDIAA